MERDGMAVQQVCYLYVKIPQARSRTLPYTAAILENLKVNYIINYISFLISNIRVYSEFHKGEPLFYA